VQVGVFADLQGADDPVAVVRQLASAAQERQPLSLWFQQGMGYDAGVMAAIAAVTAPSVDLGISVIPAPTRHPLVAAQLAATLQTISRARFTLGLGTSHLSTLRDVFAIDNWSPADTMRHYLDELLPALEGNTKLRIAPVPRSGIVLGALLPRMLRLAGERTDGTVTWLTGSKTLRNHIVPRISQAAADAGREAPRVVAVVPLCVTKDVAAARERVNARLAHTANLPSYRAMLTLEGVQAPSDIAICGDDAAVRGGIDELRDAGVTELVAMVLSPLPDDWKNTLDLLHETGTP
jgi:5,10-methylenetetrahydromethanopterin reductase